MSSRKFWFFTILILVFVFMIRIIPLFQNNFYFTMDQGNDAIAVREILVGHKLTLRGPETSIFGLYAGPLWYYFIAIGYYLSGGHPVGPVVLLIVLNTFLTFLIIKKISVEVSPKIGLLIGALLQISWWFYDSSRYAFNPFPDTFLAFLALFCLTDFLKGETKKYYLAAILFGLFFHTDLASAIAANLFFFGFGLFSLTTRRLKWQNFIIANALIALFLLPHLASEVTSGFPQTGVFIRELTNPGGVLRSSQVGLLSKGMFLVVSRSIYRQIPEIGFLGAVIVLSLFIKRSTMYLVNPFVKNFVVLTILMLITAWLFFSSNLGWRDWQTSFLSPLIFVSVLLALTELHSFIFVPMLLLTLFSHLSIFVARYRQSLGTTDDPSILANEIRAIDWVYAQTKNRSMSVYVWVPSIFDYHFQYLYWWYGKNKYGYFPCEVNTFPKSPKTYLPQNYKKYEQPKGNCPAATRLLIMEPDKNNSIDQAWYADITTNTTKISQTNIGKLRLEMLELK